MSSQNRSGQIIKPCATVPAQIALSMPMSFIMTVTDYRNAGARWAVDAIQPPMLTDQLITLAVIKQGGQIDDQGSEHRKHRFGDDLRHRID
jgi:hypothetical protein